FRHCGTDGEIGGACRYVDFVTQLHALPALTLGLLFEHRAQVIFRRLADLAGGVGIALGGQRQKQQCEGKPGGKTFSASARAYSAKRKQLPSWIVFSFYITQ